MGEECACKCTCCLHYPGVSAKLLEFETMSGVLTAELGEEGFICLDMPSNPPHPQDYDELADLLKVSRLFILVSISPANHIGEVFTQGITQVVAP